MKNIQQPTAETRPANNIQFPTRMDFGRRWMFVVGCWMLDVPKFFLMVAIRAYQLTISPAQSFLFGATGGCRYTPTCSVYATDALRGHGAVAGTVLAAKRICRCHPWGGCGHDPVPPKNPNSEIRVPKFI